MAKHRPSRCGKKANEFYPSVTVMRRSIGAYERAKSQDAKVRAANKARVQRIRSSKRLALPSKAKRPQLCRYIRSLKRSTYSGASPFKGYYKARAPAGRYSLPVCGPKAKLCGRTCMPMSRSCHMFGPAFLPPLAAPPALPPL